MSKFLVTLITVVSLFAMVTPDADARRMGGSRSFGKQSSNVTTQKAPAQPTTAGTNQAAPAAGAATGAAGAAGAAKAASPWKGMLGGALLGLGLGALLSGLGFGAGMANIISILLMAGIAFAVVMLLMRLFRQKSNASSSLKTVYAGQADNSAMQYSATPEIGSRLADAGRDENNGQQADGATWEIPTGFDVPQFERIAQTHFIRMQAAWDRADINDIREFTTPEMYAELKLQLQERGDAPSVTEVMTINAKLLGVETLESNYLASVRFVGTIREDNSPTVSFDEVWNLSKPIAGSGGWLLAGIQQAE